MAVMQTPHGRVVGLILPKEDQPQPKAIEKEPEATIEVETKAAAPAKRAGRPAKK